MDCARQLAHEKGEWSPVQYKEKRGVQSRHSRQVGPLKIAGPSCTAIRINLYRSFEIRPEYHGKVPAQSG